MFKCTLLGPTSVIQKRTQCLSSRVLRCQLGALIYTVQLFRQPGPFFFTHSYLLSSFYPGDRGYFSLIGWLIFFFMLNNVHSSLTPEITIVLSNFTDHEINHLTFSNLCNDPVMEEGHGDESVPVIVQPGSSLTFWYLDHC